MAQVKGMTTSGSGGTNATGSSMGNTRPTVSSGTKTPSTAATSTKSSGTPVTPSTSMNGGGYGGATANPAGYTGNNIFSDYTPPKATGDSGGGYTGGGYGGGYTGGGSSGGGSSTPAAPAKTPEEIAAEKAEKQKELEDAAKEDLAKHWADAASTTQGFVEKAELDPANIDRVDHIDTAELRDMLQQIVENQKQQNELRVDRTVEQGVNELNRALEDADPQFQAQRNQVSADEARALDNQALYAEARGDRGGIGAAQYASIQNNAATNRLKVNQAQTKLSTDTARQIADLRAQGEFQKADALLSITQSYLSELKSLEQWALQTNLSVDEFNIAVDEWEAEFNRNAQQFLINTELSTAQVTGAFANGTPTLAARQQLQQQLAQAGQAMLEMGLTPTPAQIEAMGFNAEQFEQYQEKNKSSGGGGGYVENDPFGYGGSYYNYFGGNPYDKAVAAAASGAGYDSKGSGGGSNMNISDSGNAATALAKLK